MSMTSTNDKSSDTGTNIVMDPEIGEGTPLLLDQKQQQLQQQQQQQQQSVAEETTSTVPAPASFDEKVSLVKEKAVAAVAGVGFLSSLGSLLFYAGLQHPTVYITSWLGIILSPYAAIQQRKITEVDALKTINEQLSNEMIVLKKQNETLQQTIESMSESVQKVRILSNGLNQMSNQQTMSITDIKKQIEQSKLILSKMEQNKQAEVLQVLLSVMLASDKDKNMILSDNEINTLIHQVEAIHDIQFQEDKLRTLIVKKHQRKVKGLLDIAKQSLSITDPNDPNSFYNVLEESTPPKTDTPSA